jgi:hypothetical protein
MLHTIPVTLWASPKVTNPIIKTCNAEYHGDAHPEMHTMLQGQCDTVGSLLLEHMTVLPLWQQVIAYF